MKHCTINNCNRKLLAKGLCNMHYKRLWRGNPLGSNEPQQYSHGLARHELYKIWEAMHARCYNENNKAYHNYGGRGIRVSDRWRNFANFLHDMGERPTPKHTLERIDNDSDYEPSNCKWATRFEQSINRQRLSCRNTSGYRGVNWHKQAGKWEVRIGKHGKTYRLGMFSDIEEANNARLAAEQRYWHGI